MLLFTVHARELLNLPGHGLGLDVSRKSRIRSGGFLKRTHGVLFGKKEITDLFKKHELFSQKHLRCLGSRLVV